MHTLTIYTPTYNRSHLLLRLYQSLCGQTLQDFLWMIIDDGSTDNTKSLVQSWINESKLEIEYYYKENGGVHTARDMAYKNVKTELITSVDSDDYMPDDAVECILGFWEKYGGDKYAGILTPITSQQDKGTGSLFPNAREATYQDFTYKYKYRGDKHTILRSDIIKSIPASPVFEGEKLIGEGYKWIQLPEDKPFLLLNHPTLIVEYQENGYSKNARSNFFKNPRGFRESYIQYIIHSKYITPRIKGYIGYILYSLYLGDRDFIKNSPKPWATVFIFPLGLAAYWYARTNWGKDRVQNCKAGLHGK